MKDTFLEMDLEELLYHDAWPSLSIYLPTHNTGPGRLKDAIRLRRLLCESEQRLREKGVSESEIKHFLVPVRSLETNGAFWDGREQGLALLLSPRLFRHFRLPIPFEDLVYVGERFHITPLLDARGEPWQFYVLALSQKRTRLFKATRTSFVEESSIAVPEGLDSTLGYQWVQHGSQLHSGRHDAKHKESVVFHGQEDKSSAHKAELRNFLRLVDDTVTAPLAKRRQPLLLAGVSSLVSAYRKVTHYPYLVDGEVDLSCDHTPEAQLHSASCQAMHNAIEREHLSISEAIHDSLDGRHASDDLRQLCQAAETGQIDTLLVQRNIRIWGSHVRGSDAVVLHDERCPMDDDLVDLVAVETLRHRGEVHVCANGAMPSDSPLAARFRYEASTPNRFAQLKAL